MGGYRIWPATASLRRATESVCGLPPGGADAWRESACSDCCRVLLSRCRTQAGSRTGPRLGALSFRRAVARPPPVSATVTISESTAMIALPLCSSVSLYDIDHLLAEATDVAIGRHRANQLAGAMIHMSPKQAAPTKRQAISLDALSAMSRERAAGNPWSPTDSPYYQVPQCPAAPTTGRR